MRNRWSIDGLLRWAQLASIGTLTLGLLVLGAYCLAEAAAHPGYSLVDAYGIGRLPWMGIAEALIVTGATACAVSGGLTVFWLGGSGLRALAIPAPLAVGVWWFTAVAMTRYAPCPVGTRCPASPPDPWAYAYSVPTSALLLLILPGMVLTLLAIVSRQRARVTA